MGSEGDPQQEMVVQECLGPSKRRTVLVPGDPGGAGIAGPETRVCLTKDTFEFLALDQGISEFGIPRFQAR